MVFFCHATFSTCRGRLLPNVLLQGIWKMFREPSSSNGCRPNQHHTPKRGTLLITYRPIPFSLPSTSFPQNNPSVKVTSLLCLSHFKNGNTQVFWKIYRGSTFPGFFTIFWGFMNFKNILPVTTRICSSLESLFSCLTINHLYRTIWGFVFLDSCMVFLKLHGS